MSVLGREMQISRRTAEAEVGLESWYLLKSARVGIPLAN